MLEKALRVAEAVKMLGWLKDGWSQRSRVDQRRRRLRQLVAMVRTVTDAADARDGSLSAWLLELQAKAMRGQRVLDAADAAGGPGRRLVAFLRGAEAQRLADAVDDLERQAGPGGDLATFVKVLRLDAATTVAAGARRQREEERRSSCSCCVGVLGAKRKRAGCCVGVLGAKRKRAACSLGADAVETTTPAVVPTAGAALAPRPPAPPSSATGSVEWPWSDGGAVEISSENGEWKDMASLLMKITGLVQSPDDFMPCRKKTGAGTEDDSNHQRSK